MKVSIVGVTGYSGLELVRLLRRHPFVTIHSVHSQSQVGQKLSEVVPHLKGILDLTLEAVNPEKMMEETELVFFATPSGVSKKMAVPFIQAKFPVIDLSGDFRLKEAGAYEKWYGQEGAPLELVKAAQYGLAEFCEGEHHSLVANPGCYATAVLLGLAPLAQKGWLDGHNIVADGKSGLSGAGKKLSEATHFVEATDNMSLYKTNQHQHIPEIMQQLNVWDPTISTIQFTTSLIPVSRGILATIYVKPREILAEEDYLSLYQDFYKEAKFVRISEKGHLPTLKQVVGSNYCNIGLVYNEATNWLTIVSVIDNLVKGAAGQAVQNLNRIGNFPQEAGLDAVPVWP